MDSIPQFKGKYLFFFTIVLGAVLASQFMLTSSLSRQEQRNAKLQLISRQKILVSEFRTVLTSGMDGQVPDRDELLELQSLWQKIQTVQFALVNGSELYKVDGYNSPEVEALFTENSPEFIALRDSLQQMIKSEATPVSERGRHMAALCDAYSEGLTAIHLRMYQENNSQLRRISVQGWGLMLATMAALAMAFLFIIRPILRKMRQRNNELQVLNHTLDDMAKMKDDFMLSLGTELRSPLEGIMGMAEMLKSSQLDADQSRLVKGIRLGIESLQRQINDLLDLSRLKRGEYEQVKSRFKLREMLEEMADLMKPLAHAKNLEIILELNANLPDEVVQDEYRIRQVLHKLLENAVKFTHTGEVVLRAEAVNEMNSLVHLRFTVRDTGVGMKREISERVFEGADPASEQWSTGMGLNLSREVVNQLGGRIWVNSEPGKGTTFSFTVVAEIASPADSRELAIRELKALVIDDNKTSLKMLVRQLSGWGIQATPFNSPGLLAEVFDNLNRFDFCIIDLEMPEMDGRSLAKKIRLRYTESELPIILVSSAGPPLVEDPDGLYSAYLTKPIKPTRLLDTISEVLGISSMEISKMAFQIKGDRGTTGPRGLRILIAQDNELIRAVTNRTMSQLGYRCELAVTQQQVIEKLRLQHYDVVLMDVKNEAINGPDTTRTIQKMIPKKQIPVIIGIADSPEEQSRGLASGMDDCIESPHMQDEIEHKIHAWFDHV